MGKKKKAQLKRAEKKKARRKRRRRMPGVRFSGTMGDLIASKPLSDEEKWEVLRVAIAQGTIPAQVIYREMLGAEVEHQETAVQLLHEVGTRQTRNLLKTFALGKEGHEKARMLAAQLLAQAGVFPREEPVRLWIRGQWQEVLLRQYEVSEEFHSAYPKRIQRMIERATMLQHKGKWKQAEKLWEQVLEIHPEVKEAYNNLGGIYEQRGDREQAVAYMKRALEIDPLYVFPRCNLALLALGEDHLEEAREWLRPVADVTQFHPGAMETYVYVQGVLALKDEDFELAERQFSMVLEMNPNHKAAKEYGTRLGLMKSMKKLIAYQHEENQKKRERERAKPIEKDAPLAECLPRLTKDDLVAMARALHFSGLTGKRKAEVLKRIAAWLSEGVDEVVRSLSDRERDALRYVSEEGGMALWEAFTGRYGDEGEESPYWIYHMPESTLGRLRVHGVLMVGSVEGVEMVLIPSDLREKVREALGDAGKRDR